MATTSWSPVTWVIVVLFSASCPLVLTSPASRSYQAPYYQNDDPVPGSYMMMFNSGHTLQDHFSAIGQTFPVTEWIDASGYFADLSDSLRETVRTDTGVKYIEDDVFGEDNDDTGDVDCPAPDTQNDGVDTAEKQNNPYWGLQYLSADQKNPTDDAYYHLDRAGEGVDVYVFDSGVLHDPTEFDNNRVIDELNVSDESFDDSTGHGTSCASLIAGKVHGVTKAATIRVVKFRRGGRPRGTYFTQALKQIIVNHNSRKQSPNFKGSVANFSFKVSSSTAILAELSNAYMAGITMVASAGNGRYQDSHYPSDHPNVIAVGAIESSYNPWVKRPDRGSNYGDTHVKVWAPGKDVRRFRAGKSSCGTGTSYSSAYVSGIMAIFYGVEGTSMNPALAEQRLLANAFDFVDLPAGTDWKNSPTIMTNTGYLRGQALNPKKPYLDGPDLPPLPAASSTSTSSSPTATPTSGCQSPNHDPTLVSFTLDEGTSAAADFNSQCGVELSPNGIQGCTLHFNPCSELYREKAIDVVLSVQQWSFNDGVTSTWPDVQDMWDAVGAIMNDCDTKTQTLKWGGFRSVTVESGVRMYNVSANQNGEYPQPDEKWPVVSVLTGGGNCDDWDAHYDS